MQRDRLVSTQHNQKRPDFWIAMALVVARYMAMDTSSQEEEVTHCREELGWMEREDAACDQGRDGNGEEGEEGAWVTRGGDKGSGMEGRRIVEEEKEAKDPCSTRSREGPGRSPGTSQDITRNIPDHRQEHRRMSPGTSQDIARNIPGCRQEHPRTECWEIPSECSTHFSHMSQESVRKRSWDVAGDIPGYFFPAGV